MGGDRDQFSGLKPDDHPLLVSTTFTYRLCVGAWEVLLRNVCGPCIADVHLDLCHADTFYLPVGADALYRLVLLEVDDNEGSRVGAQPCDVRTMRQARQIERTVRPEKPDRCHMRKASCIDGAQMRRHVGLEHRTNPIRVQESHAVMLPDLRG